MSDLKRDLIKYCRDKAKSKYNKESTCYICGSSDNLDFHHVYSMTELLNVWLKKNGLNPTTSDEIKNLRDTFIDQHTREIYEEVLTLCHLHHLKLHSIYGKKPALITAEKQKRWAKIQREKNGLVVEP